MTSEFILGLALIWSCLPEQETNLQVVVASGGSSVVVADVGELVQYEVTGVLSNANNEGLARFLLDLTFSGGPLTPADAPTGLPMTNFARPAGITNPAGFGGTVIDGVLVQVGGAQNTMNNTGVTVPYPIGSVITGVGHTPVVLVTGSFVAPVEPGTYTLRVSNVSASVIRKDEDGEVFWATERIYTSVLGDVTVWAQADCGPCETPQSEEPVMARNRYLSLVPRNESRQTALRVRLVNLPPPHNIHNGIVMWVGEPHEYCENSGQEVPPPQGCGPAPGLENLTFMAATLECEPYYTDWTTVGPVSVHHTAIVPGGIYEISAIDEGCFIEFEGNYSAPLEVTTSIWGDLVGTCAVIPCTPPEGVVNMGTDVTACLDKFRNLPNAVLKSRADIEPQVPDLLINISDVTYVLDAFRGFEYPFEPGPPLCGGVAPGQ